MLRLHFLLYLPTLGHLDSSTARLGTDVLLMYYTGTMLIEFAVENCFLYNFL